MTDFSSVDGAGYKPKSFWKRPEGVTGTIFLIGVIGLAGFLLVTNITSWCCSIYRLFLH